MTRTTTTRNTTSVFQLMAFVMGGILLFSHVQKEGQLTTGYIRSLANTVDNHEEKLTTSSTSHDTRTGGGGGGPQEEENRDAHHRHSFIEESNKKSTDDHENPLNEEEKQQDDDPSSIIEMKQDTKKGNDHQHSGDVQDRSELEEEEEGSARRNNNNIDEANRQSTTAEEADDNDKKKPKRTPKPAYSSSTITKDVAAASSAMITTTTALPSITTGAVGCKEMFMGGMEPLSPQSKDNTAWQENQCDNLFCDKIIPRASAAKPQKDHHHHNNHEDDDDDEGHHHDDNNNGICKWSHYAIDLLLENTTSICTPEQIEEFYMDPKWHEYRFSDYVRRRLPRKVHSLPEQFPNSLIDAVYKARNAKVEYPIAAAVAERVAHLPPAVQPKPNTLVIHLRLGDVVDGAVDPVRELMYEQKYYFRRCKNETMELCHKPWELPYNLPFVSEWNLYVRPLTYYSSLMDLDRYTSVVIMGSAHMADYKRDATKSCHYTVALQTYLQRRMPKATVELRLGRPPDDDIMFGAQVAGYIPAGGGFSNSVAKLNKQFKEIDVIRNILLTNHSSSEPAGE